MAEYNSRPEVKARSAAKSKEWRARNQDHCRARCRARKAAKLKRTPAWSDSQAIEALYAEARLLEELTGIQFHVDHIVPMQGELVSGLHVEANLQLLMAHENLSKSNKFDPATFCA
jgi:hypothetical protein